MSRSFKKNNVSGITTARSEKEFKQQEHGRERAAVRDMLAAFNEDCHVDRQKFGNQYVSPKDGKRYNGKAVRSVRQSKRRTYRNGEEKEMRK